MKNGLKVTSEIFYLSKFPLCCFLALSSVFGLLFVTNRVDFSLLMIFIATLALSTASALLNQYQDMDIDQIMSRTKSRKYHLDRIGKRSLFACICFFLLMGLALCTYYLSLTTALLGMLAICFYNGIYTPLKRKTHLSIIAGAFCGVIPPLMGMAAEKDVTPPITHISFVALVFFIWQFPHTWIILLKNIEDYKKTNTKMLSNIIGEAGLRRILYPWIILFTILVTSSPLFLEFGQLHAKILIIIDVVLIAISMVFTAVFKASNLKCLFFCFNLSLLFFMVACILRT